MAWMITCDDGPKGVEMRADQKLMDAMWDYELSIKGDVLAAGSLRSDDGHTHIGSLLILDVETKEQALKIFQDDPATRAGMRENIQIKYWNPAILNTQVIA